MVFRSKEEYKLLKKLKNAYVVCKDCGFKYGVYSVGCSSSYLSKCDVCDEHRFVTEARDYAYLYVGIRKIELGQLRLSTSESQKPSVQKQLPWDQLS